MGKDFERWNGQKTWLNDREGRAFFNEREVWWCRLGANIGHEQDGSGPIFVRPVVVVAKINLDTCIIVPLTSRVKVSPYHIPVGYVAQRKADALISQIRMIDQKRLSGNKICMLDISVFARLIESIQNLFPKSFHHP